MPIPFILGSLEAILQSTENKNDVEKVKIVSVDEGIKCDKPHAENSSDTIKNE